MLALHYVVATEFVQVEPPSIPREDALPCCARNDRPVRKANRE